MMSDRTAKDRVAKVVVLTGASGGIGTELARQFLTSGYSIALIDREMQISSDISAERERVMPIVADVTDGAAMRLAAKEVRSRFGGVHVLVANAGIGPEGGIFDTNEESWRSVLDVNLTGVFNSVQAFLPTMQQVSGSRSIVVMSSVLAIRGARNMLAYSASKSGLIGFIQSVAPELAGEGITINALAPGPICTSLLESIAGDTLAELERHVPLRRLGTPEDIAEAVIFLSGEAATFITGQVLVIDGGLSGRAYWRDRSGQ